MAYAFPATTEDDARAILHEREKRFFDARHHCAAWRLRSGGWRAIDAGEPSGSAGTPILAAIDSRGLADVGVVVTRYFGGTKLGIGGLARAYGEAAAAALDSAPIARAIPADRLEIRYPYSLTHVVMRSLERFPAREVEHGTSNDGSQPVVRLTLPVSEVDAFASSLRDRSGGELVPRKVGEGLVLDLVRGAG